MNLFARAVEIMQTNTEKNTFDILQDKCGHVNGFVYLSQACAFVCPKCGDMYDIEEEPKTE